MATFVQLTEEDPALDLVDLVIGLKYKDAEAKAAEKEKELAQLKESVAQHKYYDVLDQTVLASIDAVLSSRWQDINSSFNLSFSLITHLDAAEAERVIRRLTAALTTNEEHSVLKIKLLSTLFNLVDTSLRFHVFHEILTFTLRTNNAVVLVDRLGKLDEWVKQWRLGDESASQLYHLAAQIALKNNKNSESHSFSQKYFSSLETADQKVLDTAKPWVTQTVNSAIQAADISLCGQLLNFRAVSQLSADPAAQPLLQLLRIVSTESVSAYQQFAAKNSQLFQDNGFDQAKLLSKMRTLTLCTIASKQSCIAFDDLKGGLEVKDDDDLERCVVEAVMSGHVAAKIDEASRRVVISFAAARNFDDESWARIGTKLESWKKSLVSVQDSLRDSLQVHDHEL